MFAELTESMEALAEARHGKLTRRIHALEYKLASTVMPQERIRVPKDLKISRTLFAVYLRTNVRTPENWKQSSAKCASRATLLTRSADKDTEGDPENEGLLEAREIMKMNLHPYLAMLSAGETANR